MFKKFIIAAAMLTAALCFWSEARADNARVVAVCGTVPQTYTAGSNRDQTQDVNGNLCTAASVSASITGFAPAVTGTAFTADTNAETGTLPAGAVVAVFNTSTTIAAFCKLGASATTSDIMISPSSWFALTVGGATQLTCITASSTAVINMVGGSGLPTGAGGGGGGSGGGAATLASGAVSSGAYSSGSFASGAFASGSVASGAFASGSIASGAMAAGAMVDFLTTRQTVAAGTVAANSQLVGGIYNSSPITMTNGQGAASQFDVNGYMKVNVAAGGAAGGTSSTFDAAYPSTGTAAGMRVGSAMSALYGTAAGADAVTNALTGADMYGRMMHYNGTTWDRARGDTTSGLWVNVKSSTGTTEGQTASGTTASPVAGEARASEKTAVTTGQLNRFVTDLVGKLITLPYANPENFVKGTTAGQMTGTLSTSMVAAPTGGMRNYLTNITCSNSHATVGTDIVIQDGITGTTLYNLPAASAYGGAALTFPTPITQTLTNTAIYVANATTGASTKCSASGYKGL